MAVVTMASLTADLRALGLAAGDVVLLHSSYKSIGSVAGGPQAVVQALLNVLGPAGTLVVPAHTPENTDPATWQHPPVPADRWAAIRGDGTGRWVTWTDVAEDESDFELIGADFEATGAGCGRPGR